MNITLKQFQAGLRLVILFALGLLPTSARAAAIAAPDFGPQVLLFDASMPAAAIQSKLDAVFVRQERSQFGTNRFAICFKPGKYELDVNVGFYTQVLGLGRVPDDVRITGSVHSEADWMRGNATCTFWRAFENLSVSATSTNPINWAVSQGTSFRRMHVQGNVNLWDGGWSSGGFMADCRIDGQVNSGSQQQWFSRNTQWQNWTGANWNMVFVGVVNPPAGAWPNPPYTVVEKTPLMREKPFLCLDSAGNFVVQVPALQNEGSIGTSWAGGQAPGSSVPLAEFYQARADNDSAASLNRALEQGKHLLFTPGIYHLDKPLLVNRPNTILLGLGYTTLVPDEGTPALMIGDIDGVKVAGIMIDAGPIDSPTLVQVGEPGSTRSHRANPICLYDLFCRVGGGTVGTASICVTLHANDVLGDNLWIWRADHGAGATWELNKSKTGLVVNGRNVTLYGLFVEHFQQYQTLWNGDGGRVYFYQCELPYDAPSQPAWEHDGIAGYAAYKVADQVKTHAAWGLGVYGVYTRTSTKCFNAFEAPTSRDIQLNHLASIWITGKPGTETTHVINGTGPAVNASNRKATLNRFPVGTPEP